MIGHRTGKTWSPKTPGARVTKVQEPQRCSPLAILQPVPAPAFPISMSRFSGAPPHPCMPSPPHLTRVGSSPQLSRGPAPRLQLLCLPRSRGERGGQQLGGRRERAPRMEVGVRLCARKGFHELACEVRARTLPAGKCFSASPQFPPAGALL